ncbi:hypothetical protein PG985_010942 [Apiospora marii]|uniref:Uncharacterized protein n=1 Tax=Apiospora marii TaxID=335849 RepID=A0ABR1SS97_9PEZI
MEGRGENPNGAGGHHDDAASRKKENARLSMMNDLGLNRMEDHAQDDDRSARQDRFISVAPPVKSNEGNEWQNAVQNNTFDDEDAKAVNGLDPIAAGRLHALRKSATAGAVNSPHGLSLARTAQSSGPPGSHTNFGNAARIPKYDPK